MTRRSREGGFALLIVLWSMVLLGLLGTRITAAGHAGGQEAEGIAERARLEASADASVAEALFHVASGNPVPQTGVRIEDEAGRINVNFAPPGLLTALLLAIGLPADRSQSLAAAISDWHTPSTLAQPFGAKLPAYRAAGLDYGPPNAPFRSMEELGLVLGMTPEILAKLEPHVSVFTEGDVQRSLADDIVLSALVRYSGNIIPASLSIGETSLILRIIATAKNPDGARFSRIATIRLSLMASDADPLIKILDWQ